MERVTRKRLPRIAQSHRSIGRFQPWKERHPKTKNKGRKSRKVKMVQASVEPPILKSSNLKKKLIRTKRSHNRYFLLIF